MAKRFEDALPPRANLDFLAIQLYEHFKSGGVFFYYVDYSAEEEFKLLRPHLESYGMLFDGDNLGPMSVWPSGGAGEFRTPGWRLRYSKDRIRWKMKNQGFRPSKMDGIVVFDDAVRSGRTATGAIMRGLEMARYFGNVSGGRSYPKVYMGSMVDEVGICQFAQVRNNAPPIAIKDYLEQNKPYAFSELGPNPYIDHEGVERRGRSLLGLLTDYVPSERQLSAMKAEAIARRIGFEIPIPTRPIETGSE